VCVYLCVCVDSLLALKCLIEKEVGEPCARQRLVFNRATLNDIHATLAECGLREGATVTLLYEQERLLGEPPGGGEGGGATGEAAGGAARGAAEGAPGIGVACEATMPSAVARPRQYVRFCIRCYGFPRVGTI